MGPQQIILNQIVKANTNIICVTIKLTNTMFPCQYCSYVSKRRYDVKRHEKALHKNGTYQDYGFQNSDIAVPTQQDRGESLNFPLSHKSFDIRLKENFKMFVSGPSRCGKTVFVSKLLEKIHAFAKIPPAKVLYIYKVWQPKYDEIMSLGVNFMEDSDNIVNDIKSGVTGHPMLVIFDDLIGSSSLKVIADLFTDDARHMNMSLVFLTQRMFVNNEAFRQISQNCDYFVLFKNPRNSSEIRTLAQQMTPGNLILVHIYMEATKGPFSYLFINLTQECDPKMKYLSDLFDDYVTVFVVNGTRFNKVQAKNNFGKINIVDNSNLNLKQFQPPLGANQYSGINPIQQKQYNVYNPIIQSQPQPYNNTGVQQTSMNMDFGGKMLSGPLKIERNTMGTYTNFGENTETQTDNITHLNKGTSVEKVYQDSVGTQMYRYNTPSQTEPIGYFDAGTNTKLGNDRFSQTYPTIVNTQSTNTPSQKNLSNLNEMCQCDDNKMEDTGLQYQSEFARSLVPNLAGQHQQSDDMHAIPKYHQQPPPALQYRQTYGVENMETDAIDYQAQQQLQYSQPQAITHTERPNISQSHQQYIIYHKNQYLIQKYLR